MKVVINSCFGGFGLSYAAVLEYARLSGFDIYAYADIVESGHRIKDRMYKKVSLEDKEPFTLFFLKDDLGDQCDTTKLNNAAWFHERDVKRDDPILVKVVENLGAKANGYCANLKIIEIPNGVEYEVEEYDGAEHIAQKHEKWY